MKGIPVMVAVLLVSSALAIAQVCPMGYVQPLSSTSSIITVPPVGAMPGSVYCPMTSAVPGTAYYYPYMATVPGTTYYPTTGAMIGSAYCPPTGMFPVTSVSAMPLYQPGMTSRDTALLLNQLAGIRADMNAMMLTAQGQMLTTRLNQLMAREQAFRQAIAANPNMPNAQMTAFELRAEAEALNRDIAAYTRQLSMIPVDQRPYMASALNTFDVVYWQPTIQAFNEYRAQWPTAVTTYQPAFAQNPWLQTWTTSYQATLVPLGQTPQVFASARWWNQPMVLGSVETYPITGYSPMMSGSTMTLPSGAVIFIPASVAAGGTTIIGTTGTTVAGTMPMGTTAAGTIQ